MTTPQLCLKALIADNQVFTRRGIISILHETKDFVVIEEAATKKELLEKLSKNKHDILILDFELFDFNEIDELQEIFKQSPQTRILIVSDNKNKNNILRMKEIGIHTYIQKNTDYNDFITAINATLENKKYFSEEILDMLLDSKHDSQKKTNLTITETEIVNLIAQGLTTKEIALKKHLSHHTIITHRKNIFRKIGINSVSELVMYAIRNGIVDTLEYYI